MNSGDHAAVAKVEAMLATLSVEAMERLARHFTPAALRSRRDRERNDLYAQLAAGQWGNAEHIAATVFQEIERYRGGAWRFERGRTRPSDPRRAMLHRVLTLSNGNALSVRSIRRLLSGVAKKTDGFGHGSTPPSSSASQEVQQIGRVSSGEELGPAERGIHRGRAR